MNMLTRFTRRFRRSRDIGSEEYERIAILQRTNMSEVWLAMRKSDKVITITKIARLDNPQYAKANQEAMRNEAQWLRAFQGQSRIIQMYHAAETNLAGRPYFIAAEYLKGGTLDDLLDQKSWLGRLNDGLAGFWTARNRTEQSSRRTPNVLRFLGVRAQRLYIGPLPVEQALQITLHIAEGLALLHDAGIVHRDMKPDNVMFRRRPQHGRAIGADDVVLIDFGIAARRDRVAGAAVSRGWSEPRRIAAKESRQKLEVKSGFDIYCLGKILRYMVTREKPQDRTEAELKAAIPPEALRIDTRLSDQQRFDLATQLSRLIRHCLIDNPDDRPSARVLADETKRLLATLAVPRRRARRRGVVMTVAASIITALLALLLFWGGPPRLQPVRDGIVRFVQDGLALAAPAESATIEPSATAMSVALATATETATETAAPEPSPTKKDTPTITATSRATQTATVTPPPTQTPLPSPTKPPATRKPTPTLRPTITPTATVVPPTPRPVVSGAEVLGDHPCLTGGTDTWGEQLNLVWRLQPNPTLLAALSLEIAVWKAGEDPLNPGQAFAIHGKEQIVRDDANGRYLLENVKPGVLAANYVITREDNLWGILQVNPTTRQRIKLLTPSGCRFTLEERLYP